MTIKDNRIVADTSGMNYEPGSWQEAVYEIYVGTHVGLSHSWYFTKWFVQDKASQLGLLSSSSSKESSGPGLKEGQTPELKVVGVGYGRTGTYSLTLALDQLGIPTLHTQHLYENEEIFAMWADQVFQPSIDNGTAVLGSPDLDLVARHGYQATMDLPMALYYDLIQEQYPNCKFILTTRDSSETWFRSWDTLTKSITRPAGIGSLFIPNVKRIDTYLRWLFALLNQDSTYLSAPFPLPDQQREAAIRSYEAHNARVRATIDESKLLEYSVKEGWEPLCEFLEISNCPTDQPFPKSNSARSVQIQSFSSFLIPLAMLLFCLFYFVHFLFGRLTGKTILQWIAFQYQRLVNGLLQQQQQPHKKNKVA